MELLASSESNYKLLLKNPIKFNIRNDGSYIYNDLQLHLDYEKVLNILMGTELYDSPDVFIREILQNAYDACKSRIDIYEKNGEDYSPRINIRYSSTTNILEIEDNGIGIDNDVFQNYLIRIGRSFYKSKTFQSQEFRFSPISNFGIGIISCFMVSDSIEIESLKCYSPSERAEPINYVLNINNKFIEQKLEKKKNFGTIIRLKLNKDYAEKFKEKNISEIIKENMTYQEIPINIEIDGEKSILDNRNISVPEDYKDISGILVFEINNIDWLEGYIVVYQSQHQSIIIENKISQQCFTITNKNSQINLAPYWLHFTKFAINLLPPKKLHLKANRNKVHEDENYFELKNFILEYIINEFSKPELKGKLINFIEDGRGNALSGNKIEYEFLTSEIPFNFFSPPSKLIPRTYKDVSKVLQGKKVAVIHPEFFQNDNIQKRWAFFFQKYDLIILQNNKIDYFYQFSKPYLTDYKIIATSISGFIYYELTFKEEFELNINDYDMIYSWHQELPIEYKGNNEELFCIVGNKQYNGIDLQINFNHKLGKLLKKTEKVSYTKRFTGSFKTNIGVGLSNHITLSDYTNYDGEHHFFLNNYKAYSLISIGIIDSKFIESLNTSLMNDLLIPLKRENHLNDENLDSYLLTENDFPEWWIKNR